MQLIWDGRGAQEQGRCSHTGSVLVEVDPRYFRPTEVDLLIGDPSKARAKLGWRHQVTFRELVAEMMSEDLVVMKRERDLNPGARTGSLLHHV